jgi:hypothetical protein
VSVDGLEINEGNVVRYLLRDQYIGQPGLDRSEIRRDRLSDLVEVVMNRLDGEVDLAVLGEELSDAVAGRHLLVWSSLAEDDRAWAAAGGDGRLEPGSLLVALMNSGANKLDQYVATQASLEVAEVDDGTDVTVNIRLQNTAPRDDPPYVYGLLEDGEVLGEYRGALAVNIPGDATEQSFDDVTTLVASGADGPTQVIATAIALKPGESRDLVLRFHLPPDRRQMLVEASARVPGVNWTAPGEQWVDEAPRRIRW